MAHGVVEPPAGLDAQIDAYIVHLRVERNLSDHTIDAYTRDLALFVEHVGGLGRSDAREVRAEDVSGFAQSLAARALSSSTQRRRMSSVRGFYRFLRREQGLSELPTEQVDLPKVGRCLPHPVDSTETVRLLAAAEGLRDRVFIALLYGGGLRVSEVVGLDLSQLHLDAGVVRVMGKGSKERIVPIGQVVVDLLRAYLDTDRGRWLKGKQTDAVFPGRSRSGRVSRQAIFLRLKRIALKAGLSHLVSPHKLRHGFATDLVRGGADLRSVQAMLGHADLRTTEVYTAVDETQLRQVYDSAHPRG